jgi:hypothetical protein
MNSMKPTAIALAIATFWTSGAQAATTNDDGVRYMSAAQISAALSPMVDGVATGPVPSGPGATVLAAHRDRSGLVELHEVLADILVDQEGDAEILVGGSVAANHKTAPGEWRGGTIAGGRRISFHPGDVIWIPAGVPHQMMLKPGATITYLAFKFSPPPPSH